MKIEFTNCGVIFNKFAAQRFSDVEPQAGMLEIKSSTDITTMSWELSTPTGRAFKIIKCDYTGTILAKRKDTVTQTTYIVFFDKYPTIEQGEGVTESAIKAVALSGTKGPEYTVQIPEGTAWIYLATSAGSASSPSDITPESIILKEKNYDLLGE